MTGADLFIKRGDSAYAVQPWTLKLTPSSKTNETRLEYDNIGNVTIIRQSDIGWQRKARGVPGDFLIESAIATLMKAIDDFGVTF